MTTATDLREARALIDTPEKWGKGTASFMPKAKRAPLCILGACLRAGVVNQGGYDAADCLRDVLPVATHRSLADFNDNPDTTHADIMALFDRAIAAEEIK